MITQINTKKIFTGLALLVIGAAYAQDNSDFKPSGNLWGYMFGDYAYKTHNDTLSRGGGNVQYKTPASLSSGNTVSASNPAPANMQTNAFQIRRVYLGYDYQFAPNLSANLVLAHEQNVDGTGNNTMFLKYANIKWSNIFKGSDLVIGQYQTASFATPFGTEPLWGYRSVERTIMDMHNTDASSDLGFSLQGKAWSAGPDSIKPTIIGYALQVGNGSSAKPESDIFKKFRGNLYVSTLGQKLTVGLYGDYVPTGLVPHYHTSNMTMKVYASFKTEKFRVGAEVFQQTNHNSDIFKVADGNGSIAAAQNDTATGVQMGWSVFASASIIKNKLNIFARYDMYNPDTKWNKSNVYSAVASGIKGSNLTTATFYTQSFLTAGLDWTPNKRFHIMPNIWLNQYKTMSGTNGPSATGGDLSKRVKSDNDMVYRVTFYFLFNGAKKVSNNGMY